MTATRRTHRRGVTLLEVLIVIGIIAILIGLLVGALAGTKRSVGKLEKDVEKRERLQVWAEQG